MILDVAADHTAADVDALERLMRSAGPAAQVYADWTVAQQGDVQGSPHLFLPDGTNFHNPGISMSWTLQQFEGLLRVERDRPGIYRALLAQIADTHPL